MTSTDSTAEPTPRCPDCNAWGWRSRCWSCEKEHSAKARTARVAIELEWFDRTGLCGGCGQPVPFCLCSDAKPCGCRDRHKMGAGLLPDALDSFAELPPVTVGDDQTELWG